VLVVAGTAWVMTRGNDAIEPGALVQPIAVAPLRDETGDTTLAALGRLAGDWITQGLHEAGGMRVVAWPAALAASEAGGDVAQALLRAAGAGTVVSGAVYGIGDSLRFQVEIIDAARALVLVAPRPVQVHRDSAM